MSSVRRVMFTVALSAVIVSVFFVGTFFETEAGDVRRGKAKTVTTQKLAATGIVQDTAVDLNADGRTDFLVARPQAAGFDSASLNSYLRTSKRERSKAIAEGRFADLQQGQSFPLVWYGLNNNAPGVKALQWGDFTTDELLTADFDGDGRDDITVWRPGSVIGEQAYFYSINSSDSTARIEPFGQIFDDPAAVGDYDGDGIDDPAVYRCPDQTVGTCYFYYRGTLNNPDRNITFIPFGIGQGFELLPVAGDFNGDGKHDFAIQGAANSNPDKGVFHILINGTFEYTAFQWGLFSDAFFAGDFDGDGTSDIVVTRFVNGALIWYVKESDGGVQVFHWGQEGDFEVPGDYDADGRTDFAIFRENATDASFWVRPSGGGSHYALSWGQPGDYPVAFSVVQPF